MIQIPRRSSIQNRLGIFFLALLLLLVTSILLTVFSLETSKQDAQATNQANLQASLENQPISRIGQGIHIYQTTDVLSSENIERLRLFQLFFLGVGVVLLGVGWWMVRKSFLLPLADLKNSANRIESGDLNTPIALNGSEEVRLLGQMMESLRNETLTSSQDLQQWKSTFEVRLQERTKELEALSTVSCEMISSLSMSEVLKSVTNKALELSNSEVASLCMLDRQGNVFNLRSTSGQEDAILHSKTPIQGQGNGDGHFHSTANANGFHGCNENCQNIGQKYRRSHLTASLYSDEKIIGELCIGSSKPNAFGPETKTVLTQLASLAAATIENATLYQQAEQTGTLEERQRVASEMHDGLLQTLSFLGIMVRRAKDQMSQGDIRMAYASLQQIERAEEQAEHEIRRAITSLQDNFPINITLQEQLTLVSDELSKSNPPIEFETETVLPLMLEHQESEQVLRIVREGLLNAQRHSQSEVIHLFLKVVQEEIRITIKDQGIGFDLSVPPNDDRDHFGIKIMQARADRLGGKLTIQSTPGAGAEIQLCWTSASILNPQGKVN